MSEKPILFSAPMVLALLEGRKTQTRRIVKLKGDDGLQADHSAWRFCEVDGVWQHVTDIRRVITEICPYGKPGDRLWARESYRIEKFTELIGIDDYSMNVRYAADGAERIIYQCDAPHDVGFWPGAAIRKYEGKNRPGRFMYRWASRITLEITEVRVQRLQDISGTDCMAEGIAECDIPADDEGPLRIGYMIGPDDGKTGLDVRPQGSYRKLWESINGAGSWDANPWVWAASFRRVA